MLYDLLAIHRFGDLLMTSPIYLPRRQFIRNSSIAAATLVGSALFTRPGLFADQLLTPAMTEGPFYPDKLPLDTDNDLLILNDSITPAVEKSRI